MKDLIINIFGTYVSPTFQNIVETADGVEYVDVIPDGFAGLDIPWIAGFALFSLVVYCVFRMLGRSK